MKTIFQDRASSWFGFTSYQEWSRNQHALMLESRKLQEKTGRIIPQTNEEYGYEDHYPDWAAPGSDSPEVLRKTAWDIYMAGGYQTAGESARRGTNIRPDTGGGWMNGRGDDTQTMFLGYGHIVEFFTAFEWWKLNPHDELVNDGNYCLADPGNTYAIYLPCGGKASLRLGPGKYRAEWFNATSGQRYPLTEDLTGPSWTSSDPPDEAGSPDWAILLQKQ
jgi:Putative collagen-binding domain of a collagenase